MKSHRYILSLGVAITIAVLSSCSDKEKSTVPGKDYIKAVPVKAVKVEEKLMSIPLHTIGKVFTQKESTLSFKTGGIIQTIYVNNGQKVRQGQLLAKLDLSEVQSSFNKARVSYEKSERDLIRAKSLYNEKVVTLETLENAQTSFDVASSDLKIAQFNLDHSIIKAPTSGLILDKLSEEGELTSPGTPIFEFAGTNQNWVVKSGLVDKEVVKIILGDSAKIAFDAYPNNTFKGLVTKIANAPNPVNGTYEVEVSLTEVPNTIKKGFIAKIDLIPSMKQNYKLIPIESLVEADQHEGTIYLVDQNQPRKVKVEVQTIIDSQVLVFGSITENDLIISEGLSDVNENSIIEIL